LLAILFTLIPSLSLASEGDVTLKFSSGDMKWLGISFVIGLIAIGAAVFIWRKTMAVSPGSEKMQAVSQAIREGALAYLKKQIATMIIFVIILAFGLFALYSAQWGAGLGIGIAFCFVAGVACSYIAGFAGMMMAVSGNTRTAAAALTSYKKALETAFRAGSVAGMVTVGMGLIGATIILFVARENAMKLLVGFGFGGSLAALFMRVGGGIFTKAADVGADLVGKVEAGIPEDDARNPATIADNVGDNVGDCAGMAADIFESYEVTLVAAIILGAATASIFDQPTWMRLVLFALMARGAGIIASIFGIAMVRGDDNVDTDPLKPISNGFKWSAGAAAVLTFALAWYMFAQEAGGVQTTVLVSQQDFVRTQVEAVQGVRDALAESQHKQPDEVTVDDVLKDPKVKAMGLTDGSTRLVQSMLEADLTQIPSSKPLVGLTKADLHNGDSPALDYSFMGQSGMGQQPTFETVRKSLADKTIKAFLVKQTFTPPANSGAKAQESQNIQIAVGTDAEIAAFKDKLTNPPGGQQSVKAEIVDSYDVSLYSNSSGDLAYVIDGKVPSLLQVAPDQSFQQVTRCFAKSPDQMQSILAKLQRPGGSTSAPNPTEKQIPITVAQHTPVEWWRFPLCLLFGIIMAFLIERLTDYYVSLHGRPVGEVAANSTTGPATMIISGFAYGMESSVFSVFAIVIALIAPMLIFPPAQFGGYLLSFYGIALVGLGLLTTTGFILGMDTFGPISDNAQGVYEMSGEGEDNVVAAKAVQRLDAAGNTTKALTKGFAIATAVVAAVALFHSYIDEGKLTTVGLRLEIPEIFLGMLIGGAAPYLFSAFSINAVGRAAYKLINEVRSQFRNDPGIMAGTSKPNYGRCVAIVTQAAQQELLGPGILAIALPAAVGFGFSIGKPTVGGLNLAGAQALGGYLAGAIISGQLMAVLLANAGGIWDNSKKLIEDGAYGGKGSEAHKAGVVCDTVGDPFKDTAGPALNPLIKVMNLVAILLAPVVIRPIANQWLILITVLCVAALVFSVYWSKRSSLSSELSAVGDETPTPQSGTA
jgi:K(+)-stimulated pyrophosphate-energized sodium pump